MATYTCAKCGGPVYLPLSGNKFERPCGHDTEPVSADISAVCHGVSGVNRRADEQPAEQPEA